MTDYLVSLIRTLVPVLIGTVVTWLATLGVTVTDDTKLGLVTALTGLLIATYYAVVRFLETLWPKVGVLLGHQTAPKYDN